MIRAKPLESFPRVSRTLHLGLVALLIGCSSTEPNSTPAGSGAGCNFVAKDLAGDGKVDIFTTNKRGTFLHVQH